jgi:hypothetical protein
VCKLNDCETGDDDGARSITAVQGIALGLGFIVVVGMLSYCYCRKRSKPSSLYKTDDPEAAPLALVQQLPSNKAIGV